VETGVPASAGMTPRQRICPQPLKPERGGSCRQTPCRPPHNVIPAKAGTSVEIRGPRFRRNDRRKNRSHPQKQKNTAGKPAAFQNLAKGAKTLSGVAFEPFGQTRLGSSGT